MLQYPGLGAHERAQVAEQGAEEYRHYAVIKDYLQSRGADVEEVPVDAYDAYFGRFLAGDVAAFRLCNVAEKSAVAFFTHLRDASKDPAVRMLAQDVLEDEEGHEEMLLSKLARLAENEEDRVFFERHFIESWTSQKAGVFLEAEELGVDVEQILSASQGRSGR